MLLISVASANKLFGQTINMPLDAVKELLCRKWDFDYAILEGQKMGAAPGAPTMNYEFNKDGTVLVTSAGLKKPLNGTWLFDAGKKLVKVTVNKQTRITITSLKQNELLLQIDTKDVTPDDPTPAIFGYRPRA